MTDRISLEKAAVEFSEANAPHPRIYELPPEEGRALLEQVQESPVNKLAVEIEDQTVDTGEWGPSMFVLFVPKEIMRFSLLFIISMVLAGSSAVPQLMIN